MQDCPFQVIQDHLILYTSAISKLHLRSAILSLILHCIVPDQVTNPLIGETTVLPWNEADLFFSGNLGGGFGVLKAIVSRLEVWIQTLWSLADATGYQAGSS